MSQPFVSYAQNDEKVFDRIERGVIGSPENFSRSLESLKASMERIEYRMAEWDRNVSSTSLAIDTLNYRLLEKIPMLDRLQRQVSYLNRPFWEKLLVRPDGKPKRLLRRFLFHVSGKPRGIFRQFFMHKDGRPSRLFRDWILSPEYQRLPRALYPVIQAEDSTGAPLLSPRTQYFLERLNRKTHN